MQQIERYGVIALVFLLVTIVAVSFWGENEGGGFWSRFRRTEAPRETEVARRDPTVHSAATRRGLGSDIPLTAQGTGRRNNGAARRVEAQPTAPEAPPEPRAEPVANEVGGAVAPGSAAGAGVPVRSLRRQPDSQRQGLRQPAGHENPTVTPRQTLSVERAAVAPVEPAARPGLAQTRVAAPPGAIHVVEKGDSLSTIAEQRLGSSRRWQEIQALNGGIDPARLRVGMQLKLPAASSSTAVATAAGREAPTPARTPERAVERTATAAQGDRHKVRRGETLSEIAGARLGSSRRWKEIVALNPGLDPNRLIVDQVLLLPTGSVREAGPALVAEARATRSPAGNRPRVR